MKKVGICVDLYTGFYYYSSSSMTYPQFSNTQAKFFEQEVQKAGIPYYVTVGTLPYLINHIISPFFNRNGLVKTKKFLELIKFETIQSQFNKRSESNKIEKLIFYTPYDPFLSMDQQGTHYLKYDQVIDYLIRDIEDLLHRSVDHPIRNPDKNSSQTGKDDSLPRGESFFKNTLNDLRKFISSTLTDDQKLETKDRTIQEILSLLEPEKEIHKKTPQLNEDVLFSWIGFKNDYQRIVYVHNFRGYPSDKVVQTSNWPCFDSKENFKLPVTLMQSTKFRQEKDVVLRMIDHTINTLINKFIELSLEDAAEATYIEIKLIKKVVQILYSCLLIYINQSSDLKDEKENQYLAGAKFSPTFNKFSNLILQIPLEELKARLLAFNKNKTWEKLNFICQLIESETSRPPTASSIEIPSSPKSSSDWVDTCSIYAESTLRGSSVRRRLSVSSDNSSSALNPPPTLESMTLRKDKNF